MTSVCADGERTLDLEAQSAEVRNAWVAALNVILETIWNQKQVGLWTRLTLPAGADQYVL